MHARELVELAAIVAAHGQVLVRGTEQLPPANSEQYWSASKCRLDRWGRRLKEFGIHDANPQRRRARWPLVCGVLEEILTGEVLARVWAAFCCAYDRQHDGNEAGPVARSVMIGHLEARHRALGLLVSGPGIEAEAAVKLNHLRRRSERWTDLLIGYLAGMADVSEWAIDPQRAGDFAEDLQHQAKFPGGRHAWPLLLASLRAAFRQGLAGQSPNADLNGQIAASVVACFPPDLFDSTGLMHPLWMLQVRAMADDAQGMLDDLLALDPPADPATEKSRRSGYWARRRF